MRKCRCGGEVAVGLGNPARWLCMKCFKKAMADLGKMVRKIEKEVQK